MIPVPFFNPLPPTAPPPPPPPSFSYNLQKLQVMAVGEKDGGLPGPRFIHAGTRGPSLVSPGRPSSRVYRYKEQSSPIISARPSPWRRRYGNHTPTMLAPIGSDKAGTLQRRALETRVWGPAGGSSGARTPGQQTPAREIPASRARLNEWRRVGG